MGGRLHLLADHFTPGPDAEHDDFAAVIMLITDALNDHGYPDAGCTFSAAEYWAEFTLGRRQGPTR